jgi:hypothetical protein
MLRLITCLFAFIATYVSANNNTTHPNITGPNNFTSGLAFSLAKDKFEEAKDVYFDMILNSILAQDMTYIDFGNN